MSEFKAIAELDRPDGYWEIFGTNKIIDVYHIAEEIHIDGNVPEEIRRRFNTAKNLIVYSWYVSHFLAIATFQSLVALELTLRWRYYDGKLPPGHKKTLKSLLDHAVKEGWLKDKDFGIYWDHQRSSAYMKEIIDAFDRFRDEGLEEIEIDDDPARFDGIVADPEYSYVKHMPKNISGIRNSLAHGSSGIMPGLVGIVERSAEIVNLLFADTGQ